MSKLAKRDETAVQAHESQPSDVLAIIANAVTDPRVDIDKMERLFALQERLIADQKRTAFMAAMSRLQAKLPQITKDGRIVVKNEERSRYVKLETLDLAIKPLLAEEGFSFSFNEESAEGKNRRFSCELAHREGHSVTKYITLPLDESGSKNGVQSAGSTASYATRYLIKMHLSIVEKGEDTDGNEMAVISEQQAVDIRSLIQETGSDEKRFLALITGTDSIESILAKDYQRVINALETKRRAKQ